MTDNVAGSNQWQWAYAEILAAYLQRESPIFRKYSEGELLALALDMVMQGFLPSEREIGVWIDALQQADRELLTDRIRRALKQAAHPLDAGDYLKELSHSRRLCNIS